MYKDLCMQYAQNRIDLKEVNRKISNLWPYYDPESMLTDEQQRGLDINLSEYRREYLRENEDWKGWVNALEYFNKPGYDKYKPREMELAILLDEKKRIKREYGNIKRRIYLNGKSLVNNRVIL